MIYFINTQKGSLYILAYDNSPVHRRCNNENSTAVYYEEPQYYLHDPINKKDTRNQTGLRLSKSHHLHRRPLFFKPPLSRMMLVLLKPCKQAKGGAGKGRKEVRRIEELGVRISERMEDIHFGQ